MNEPILLKKLDIKIIRRQRYIENPRYVPEERRHENIIEIPEFDVTATLRNGEQVPVIIERGEDMINISNVVIEPEEIES